MEAIFIGEDKNRLYFRNYECRPEEDIKNDVIKILILAGFHVVEDIYGPSETVYKCSRDNQEYSLVWDWSENEVFIYSEDESKLCPLIKIFESYNPRYVQYSQVRLRNGQDGTIVDFLGEDYVVDIGEDEKTWDTVLIKHYDVLCELKILRNSCGRMVEVEDISGKTIEGEINTVTSHLDNEFGIPAILIEDVKTKGLVEYQEYEIERIIYK